MADVLGMAAAERGDLADQLELLRPEQWEAPSLCEGWTVRQVAAHVIGYDALGWAGAAWLMARNRFSLDRANDARLGELADWSTERVLAEYRAHLTPRGVTAAFGGRIGLIDAMIHHEDIRRPLGLPRRVPEDRLREALGFAPRARALPAPRLARGLRLVATDLDWSHGEGPEATGPGIALLLAMAGRTAALGDLGGEGVVELARRIDA